MADEHSHQDSLGGGYDAYFAKFNPEGIWQLGSYFGGSKWDHGNALAVDDSMNLYIIGNSNSDSTIATKGSFLDSNGTNQYLPFLAKFDVKGQRIWSTYYGSEISTAAFTCTVDGGQNVYIAGSTSSKTGIATPKAHQTSFGKGASDGYIAKFSGSGHRIWGTYYGGDGDDDIRDCIIDEDQHLFILGSTYSDSAIASPDAFKKNYSDNGDVFFAKFDTNGMRLSSTYYGGAATDLPSSCASAGYHKLRVIGQTQSLTGMSINKAFQKTIGGKRDGFIADFCISEIDTVYKTHCDSVVSFSGNRTWKKNGYYKDTSFNTNGCHDFYVVRVEITGKRTRIDTTVCDSFYDVSNNRTWTTSGISKDTFALGNGCDSIVSTFVTVHHSKRIKLAPVVCGIYLSPSGQLWDTSGLYKDSFSTTLGCDSIFIIDLTVNRPSSYAFKAKSCGPFTSPSGNYTWTTSGSYSDTLVNAKGCDSVLNITLHIVPQSANFEYQSACDSFVSPSGKHTWKSSGIFSDTLKSSTGCDSIITLTLKLGKTTFKNSKEHSCGPFDSPSHKYQWTKTGTYADTITNTSGCPDILTISLEVVDLDTSLSSDGKTLSANMSNARYRWLSCLENHTLISGDTLRSFTPIHTGMYALEVSKSFCKDTSNCYKIVIQNLGSKAEPHLLSAYPNPSTGTLTLELDRIHKKASISILNNVGQLIETIETDQTLSSDITLPKAPGIYFVKASTPTENLGVIKVIRK